MIFTSSEIFQQQRKFEMYNNAKNFEINMVEVFGAIAIYSKSQS